jgi:carbon-monoxide dehydrogenase medium subunit
VEAQIALGAVAPTPILATGAGEALVGSGLADSELATASSMAAEAAAPISDVRGSAEHRTELVRELTERALRTARERA